MGLNIFLWIALIYSFCKSEYKLLKFMCVLQDSDSRDSYHRSDQREDRAGEKWMTDTPTNTILLRNLPPQVEEKDVRNLKTNNQFWLFHNFICPCPNIKMRCESPVDYRVLLQNTFHRTLIHGYVINLCILCCRFEQN